MSAPFFKYDLFGYETGLVIAFIIGILFGFTLERAGFGSARKLALQFYFRDMTVLKVMFAAIITAMVGLLYLNLANVLDISLVYINPTYLWPQIAGGVIMGVGFVVGGYCPGTSLVASATGKLDGIFYIAGALLGMLIYGETFPLFQDFAASGAMGKMTLSDWLHIRPGVVAFLVILMALGMFWGAEMLEKRFGEDVNESSEKRSITPQKPKSSQAPFGEPA